MSVGDVYLFLVILKNLWIVGMCLGGFLGLGVDSWGVVVSGVGGWGEVLVLSLGWLMFKCLSWFVLLDFIYRKLLDGLWIGE